MKKNFYLATALLTLLTGCTTPEEDAANRLQAERYRQEYEQRQRQQATDLRNSIEYKCQNYGFRLGTDSFANCVRSEYGAIENNKRREQCLGDYERTIATCTLGCAARPNPSGRYQSGALGSCEAECKSRAGPPNCR